MKRTRKLRIALIGNALFSALSGALMLFAPEHVNAALGWTGPDLWRLIGAGLWVFSADLVWQARRHRPIPWRVLVSSAGDGVWVLATIGLAVAVPALMSATGWTVATIVAAIVALFGVLQLHGLDRLYRTEGGDYALSLTVPIRATIEKFWPILADLGAIETYAPGLSESRLIDGSEAGLGTRRECVDRGGKRWRETVTDWSPGKGLDLRFECEAADFPFPFSRMSGGWRLSKTDSGHQVAVIWTLRPNRAWMTPILLPLMETKVVGDMRRLIRNMDRAALAEG